MREATILAVGLAMVLGLVSVVQLGPVFTTIQAATTGALSQFSGLMPLIIALTAALIVVAFAISLVGRN